MGGVMFTDDYALARAIVTAGVIVVFAVIVAIVYIRQQKNLTCPYCGAERNNLRIIISGLCWCKICGAIFFPLFHRRRT
jgi:hypothetical protein